MIEKKLKLLGTTKVRHGQFGLCFSTKLDGSTTLKGFLSVKMFKNDTISLTDF
jgi:hypothetical protein